MSTSITDQWESVRRAFVEQFEQNGSNFVYRRSQKGEAFRVSAEERRRFIEDFNREVRRGKWILYAGITLVFGGVIGFSLLRSAELSPAPVYGGMALVTIACFARHRWVWAAPARELAGRTPVAGPQAPDEVRRLRLQRLSYGQLGGAAAFGLMIPLAASGRGEVLSGWNPLWLICGAAIVLLAAVQAFRKWRLEREHKSRNVSPSGLSTDQLSPATSRFWQSGLWRYFPVGAFVLGGAFLAYSAPGRRLAKQPSFLVLLLIGLGVWALFTVAQGLGRGRIAPFARGVYRTFDCEAQPKRFWASITWNSVLGCLLLWGAYAIERQTAAEALVSRCQSSTATSDDAIVACAALVRTQPSNPDPYLWRGSAYLNRWKLDQAIADFTHAHNLAESSPWPLANRGLAYAWKNDRYRAERDFHSVKAIDPNNVVMLHGEAVLSMNAGDLERAISQFTALLDRDPNDAWALQTRADAYQQAGEFAKARADKRRLGKLVEASARDLRT